MTIAEHVLVFIAILIGLAVSTLAINLHKLLVARDRVRWDWLAPLVALLLLFIIVSFWWASFTLSANTQRLTIGAFLPDLTNVLLLFLAVAAALPEEVPPNGLDLRRFYLDRAPYLWTMISLSLAWNFAVYAFRASHAWSAGDWLLRGGLNVVFLTAFTSLVFVRKVWVHGIVIAGALTISLFINLAASINR